MQESLHQTAIAGVSLSDSRCSRLSIIHRMQEYFHQTAIAGVSLSVAAAGDSIRQRMQETLYHTADA